MLFIKQIGLYRAYAYLIILQKIMFSSSFINLDTQR